MSRDRDPQGRGSWYPLGELEHFKGKDAAQIALELKVFMKIVLMSALQRIGMNVGLQAAPVVKTLKK